MEMTPIKNAEENDKLMSGETGNIRTQRQPPKTATELAVTALHVLSTLLLIIICAFLLTQHFRLNRLQTFQSVTAEKILKTFPSSGNLTVIQLESMPASDTSENHHRKERVSSARRSTGNHSGNGGDVSSIIASANKALDTMSGGLGQSIQLGSISRSYKPNHCICYQIGNDTATSPYILWENPEESSFEYLTHNSFPEMAYHRDHFMAPYDGMYQVNVKVTFRGRAGTTITKPCAANLKLYKTGDVDTSPDTLSQFIVTQSGLGTNVGFTNEGDVIPMDTVSGNGVFPLNKGDYVRVEMDSASRECCYSAQPDKTSLGITILSYSWGSDSHCRN